MQLHYNAFISYRHHPEDIRVASEIHRLLERFRVPKGLKRKVGRIERIFRDKDELPITSNLTDDITAALRNSDFLIVICSEHTKESVWVQREIETFLQTHSRHQVLTVVCGGEPFDVIPEILLREEVTDPVTGERVQRTVEPLSCDWRMPAKQARREELPRLAAALLGCAYDELRRRQRQYRLRRLIIGMTAAVTVSLSLAGYFLYTSITIQKANVQIQANLEEAMRNQSRFLSNAAQERLEAGDRLTAIALAVEALPEYPGERPYVPDAEYVLSNALGVYKQEDIVAVGAMGRDGNNMLVDFWVSEHEQIAVIQDARGILTTWDSRTMNKIAVLPVESNWVEQLVITKDRVILLRVQSPVPAVYAITPEGKVLWEKSGCMDMEILPDGTVLLLWGERQQPHLLYADPNTGKNLCAPVAVMIPDSENQPSEILEGGRMMGDAVVLACDGFSESDVVVLASGAQVPEVLARGIPYISDSLVTGDGRLVLMNHRNLYSPAGMMQGSRINGATEYDILCYDMATKALQWSEELITYSYTGLSLLEQIPDSEKLLCISGNLLKTLDLNTGEELARCETGSGILDAQVRSDYVLLLLQDGYYCNYGFEDNLSYERPYLENNLRKAEIRIGDGLYGLQQLSGQVTVYRPVAGQRQWEIPLEENLYISNERIRADRMAVTSGKRLFLFDLGQKELLWETEVGYADMLDFSQDGSRIWMMSYGRELITAFPEDGHAETSEFPGEWEGETYRSEEQCVFLFRDTLHYIAHNGKEARMFCWDLMSGAYHTLQLPGEIFSLEREGLGNVKLLGCTDGYAWMTVNDRQLYRISLEDGSTESVLRGTEDAPALICRDGSRAIFAVGSMLYGFDGEEQMFAFSQQENTGCSVFLREEDLLVLCDNGHVYRCDYSGNRLSDIPVEVYNTFASSSKNMDPYIPCWYVAPENRMIVNAAGVATVIDCENWGACAGIVGFSGYDPEENVLLLKTGGLLSGSRLICSAEELLEIAREQLNGYALSEEECRYYGIG